MKHTKRLGWLIPALVAALVAPALATAQDVPFPTDGLQIDSFEPAPDQRNNILNTYGSAVIDDGSLWSYSGGVFYHYAHRPLSLLEVSSDTSTVLVGGQHKIEPWMGFGFLGYFDLGIIMPLAINDIPAEGSRSGEDVMRFGLGDLRVVPKVRFLNPKDFGGFGLALAVPLYIPTGDEDEFTTTGAFRVEPRLIADYTFDFGLQLAANVGYQIRSERTVVTYVDDDLLRWSVAAAIPLYVDGLDLVASFFGDVKFAENKNPLTVEDSDSNYPMELAAAVRYNAPFGLHALAGGGIMINSGIGAPEWRILASVGFQPPYVEPYVETRDPDPDGDGVCDPWVQESGFITELCTGVDKCPTIPGLAEFHGCPNPDTDGDKVCDAWVEKEGMAKHFDCSGTDLCPDVPGELAHKGCINPDTDGDGICDAWVGEQGMREHFDCVDTDMCPNLPGLPEFQGCPNPDTDGDRVCDPWVNEYAMWGKFRCEGIDLCPEEAGPLHNDGCPEPEAVVVITEEAIELKESVYFDTGKSTIKQESFPLLDQVAKVMDKTPRIKKVMIAGHTDDVGRPANNLQLSKERAASVVEYLTSKGIDPARLSSEGFGQDAPLVDIKGLRRDALKEARARNRRVEIKILELAE